MRNLIPHWQTQTNRHSEPFMPKAISCSMVLTGARTRQDGSLGLSMATPELEPSAKTAFFELMNLNLKVIIQPMDEAPDSLVDVKAEFENKSPGQRLRAVLFVLWKQQQELGEFSDFYRHQMNALIEQVKGRLQPA